MAFIRDAKEPGGSPSFETNTPIIITGDMNFVGTFGQLETFLTGDISNNGISGPDFSPDWDNSDLTSITPRHSDQRMGYTWRSDTENNFWPGHLDYFIYSDSLLEVPKRFVVHTISMSQDRLSQYNLQSNDSLGSDHLLFVTDFRHVFVDTDENGLPDSWERLTFGEISLTNGQTDLDFDGASNLDEFWTGTDPKNRESVLQVTIHQANSGELIVSWPSVLDRSYTVELSSDLRSWSALTASIQGTGEALNRELFREPSDKIFYRIRAE